ncbi:MAG: ABC transporter ATP-binding protein [Planctomycetaceae bacterium]
MNPIGFERLTHYYGTTKALDALTLEVPAGCVFALLGRNGAGKTTAIKCLLGFLPPTRGRARILGHAAAALPPEARGRIGYVAEGQRLVPWMRVRELAAYQRASFPRFDAELCDAHLRRLGLPLKRRVFQLSRGMRAQLALALALAQRPELVVLDDPAMGLDAVVRREFLDVMIDLIAEEGSTVLFSSHILTDVERVADRVAILDRGVLRVDATLDELKRRVRRFHAHFDGEAPPPPPLPGLLRAHRRRSELVLTVVDGAASVEPACRKLGARAVEAEPLGLEDLFVDYTAERGEGAQ